MDCCKVLICSTKISLSFRSSSEAGIQPERFLKENQALESIKPSYYLRSWSTFSSPSSSLSLSSSSSATSSSSSSSSFSSSSSSSSSSSPSSRLDYISTEIQPLRTFLKNKKDTRLRNKMSSPPPGGIIIMHLGEQPGLKVKDWTKKETTQVYGQLEEQMNKIHEAGFLHVDPRPPNFMYFPHTKSYDWIDFDHAVPMDYDGGALVELQKGSGHYEALPERMKRELKKKEGTNFSILLDKEGGYRHDD
eukprot:CAMPEP_0201503068 /NCGR_PEP_ID=MMETSP0151_2-20130828/84467_1 /ASSEMBLY_ACC=CAM_ASM_000257 /TAXON_ID=200890 /ORGANISM="Paramoeba atlantica, Strain 621/1 / CCAP 1560/9" /LENGTH=247 /DNA_ID=CAMNT_0047896699 /DNA_START=1797 /DNA_END=2540 /DNA_ORIENTATION=+